MGKPSSPPPPNYGQIASDQGAANKDTALFNANLNRVDQNTPYGSLTWTLKPGADPNNPKPGDYIQTQSLSPGQQRLQQGQDALSLGYLNTASNQLPRINDQLATPFSTSGLPELSGGPGAGNVQTSLNYTGMPAITDYGDKAKQVSDALMARINPQLDQQDQAERTRLLNSGIEQGSAGWDSSERNRAQARNDANTQAILAGNTEARAGTATDLASRGQLANEQLSAANFGNAGLGQLFSQGLASSQFGNQARQQGLTEEAYLRSLPLNEANALRTGSQVTMPNFNPYGSSNAQPAPVFDAANAQSLYNQNLFGTQQSGYNASASALSSAAMAAALYFSDARLKKNIQTIGQHPSGVRRVRWDWLDGSGSGTGVLAQELLSVRPDAVGFMPGGFLGVNYSMIGGR